MSDIIMRSSSELIPLPPCRAGEVNIRPATLADLPFIDSLQKVHTKMVGWMPTATLEGKIKAGHVLVAEEGRGERGEGRGNARAELAPCPWPLAPTPLGYLIATDQYFKHDDVGIIYQLNVAPGRQRGLIGASLLKAQFDRSAYGCKLYCCWCAQDIAANHFWEAMGFVPLAFRTGGRKGRAARGEGRAACPERSRRTDGISLLAPDPSPLAPSSRVHIFWQKRIRQGDTTTPWWFPSKTAGGSIREDRIVLPIPPGVRWNDEMPRILPGERHEGTEALRHEGDSEENPKLEDRNSKQSQSRKSEGSKPKHTVRGPGYGLAGSKLHFAPVVAAPVVKEKPPREKRPRLKAKHDPKLIAAAREVRDRWLEEVNAGRYLPMSAGKYEIARCIEQHGGEQRPLMLNAA